MLLIASIAYSLSFFLKEPSEAKYRLFYALLLWDKKPKEEGTFPCFS